MKKHIILLVISIVSRFGFSAEQETLPVEPWRAIIYMETHYQWPRWNNDISIKIFGSYTQADSLMVENAIEQINQLSETIQLNLTDLETSNLKFYFIDSTNLKAYQNEVDFSNGRPLCWKYNSDRNNYLTNCSMAVRMALVPDDKRQHFLSNALARVLYPGFLSDGYTYKNGRKVLGTPESLYFENSDKSFFSELSSFDRSFIQSIYAYNYPELLATAQEQLNPVPGWVRKNALNILIFPYVLSLFLFAGLIILFYKKAAVKIKSKLLRFNVISALALLAVGVSTALFIVYSSRLEDPYFSFYNILDIAGAILVLLVLGLPALNLIRFIELTIHRMTKHKYFKVLLLFLSTSLIPSATLSVLVYVLSSNEWNDDTQNKTSILLFVFVIVGVIRGLISFFISKEKEIKIASEVKLAELRNLKTKAELNALHSKINPHFLYNSLNSIAGLAKIDSGKAEHMALLLSKLFRSSINKEQSDWSTLEEELDTVKTYLQIEKIRFDDRMDFMIEVADNLKEENVPRFILQPLVENAIKHGIANLPENGRIRLSIYETDDQSMEIAVYDNGPDFPNDIVPGFGVQSIYDKLEIFYPNRFEVHFINDPQKHVLIKLKERVSNSIQA